MTALDAVPEELVQAGRSLGASAACGAADRAAARRAAAIITGMRLAMGGAWTSIVAAELIAGHQRPGLPDQQRGREPAEPAGAQRDRDDLDPRASASTACCGSSTAASTPPAGKPMTLHLHWYLPTNGDGRGIVGSGRAGASGVGDTYAVERAPTIDYLGQIARSVEQLGFEAVLTPTGSWCEDAWLTTAALSQVTKRLKFLVAFRPGFISPTLAAQQAQTFQRISGGRLLLNVVTGGDPIEQRRFGDFLAHDERYARTARIPPGAAWREQRHTVRLHRKPFPVEGATAALSEWGLPPLFFGGASPAAENVAANHVDVYLAWGETPPQIKERLARMREKAAAADAN